MKNLFIFIISLIFLTASMDAQIATIWKNGDIVSYVVEPDSLVFEENVDLNKFPPKLHSFSYRKTEDSYIFSIHIKTIVDEPISNYGWEISDDNDFLSACSAGNIKESIIEVNDDILTLCLSKEYVLNSLRNHYLRAYASHTSSKDYSEGILISDVFLGLKWDGKVNNTFSGGKGTYLEPYEIANGADLALISKYPDKYYILIDDIDLNNQNWTPLKSFSGKFDGNNKTIKNLYIQCSTNNVGLFGETTAQSEIKNLNVENVKIDCSSSSYVGSLAGIAAGNYSSCNVFVGNGFIKGNEHVGGMFGQILHNGDFKEGFALNHCSVTSNLDKPCILGNTIVGGFSGSTSVQYYNYPVNLSNITCNASIKGQSYVGGLFGKLQSFVYLNNARSECNLVGEVNIGGIAGEISTTVEFKCEIRSVISNCTIEGNNRIGGFAGTLECFPIVASYSKGKIVASGKYVGGFIGYNEYVYQSSTKFDCCYCAMDLPTTAAGFAGYAERSIIYNNCFTNAPTYYNDKGYFWDESLKIINCQSSCKEDDIVNGINLSTSEYKTDWNLDSTWTWSGKIKGTQVSLSCPKLIWE